MTIRLMWKLEDGEGEEAVGPAWIDRVGDDGRTTSTEKAADGEWISRQEARELAATNGWQYAEDAPDEEPPQDEPVGQIDLRAVNRKLRALGIDKDDLSVGSVGDDTLFIQGAWLDRLPSVDAPRTNGEFTYRTAAISATPEELVDALDLLAPGWRTE